MENPFKLDLTEEKRCMVRDWLAGKSVDASPARLMMWYGAMRKDEKIEGGEMLIQVAVEKRQEAYKWKMERLLQQNLEDFKKEYPGNDSAKYEIRRQMSWEDGRSVSLGILQDYVDGKLIYKKTVEIEERENPSYYNYVLSKYTKDI